RLEAWQACLKARKRGLSREDQIGLICELIVLRALAEHITWPNAIEAWQGPLNGLHDFTRVGVAIEVKGTAGVGGLLRISRLDQLETAGLSALALARVRLREDAIGKSLPDVVSETRTEIAKVSPLAGPLFDEKVMRAGYLDIDARLYERPRFSLDELYGF